MFGYAKFVWLRDGVFLSYGKREFIATSKRNIDGESIGSNCKETEMYLLKRWSGDLMV